MTIEERTDRVWAKIAGTPIGGRETIVALLEEIADMIGPTHNAVCETGCGYKATIVAGYNAVPCPRCNHAMVRTPTSVREPVDSSPSVAPSTATRSAR